MYLILDEFYKCLIVTSFRLALKSGLCSLLPAVFLTQFVTQEMLNRTDFFHFLFRETKKCFMANMTKLPTLTVYHFVYVYLVSIDFFPTQKLVKY